MCVYDQLTEWLATFTAYVAYMTLSSNNVFYLYMWHNAHTQTCGVYKRWTFKYVFNIINDDIIL